MMTNDLGGEWPPTNADKDISHPRLSAFVPAQISKNLDALIASVVALASLFLYLRTLAPDVVDADGGEFQFAAWNFSFVHPTGYPLYLILGGLFQHLLPIGNPAYRLNLFTAMTAALAVGALYFAVREITQRRTASLIAVGAFALTRAFWYDASAAETYDLNAFFIALLIFIALRWQGTPSARTLAAFCFVYGLALTHHRTIILWIPAFALFFLMAAWRLRGAQHRIRIPALLFRSAAFFLLPLLLYLYIPLRAPVSPYAALALSPGRELVLYDSSSAGLVNYFLGRVFQSELRWDATSVARLESLPHLLLDQFTLVGLVFGVAGIFVMLWQREWARFGLLAVGFVAAMLFAALYHIGDIFHYYIPAYLVWAVWIGEGIAVIVETLAGRLWAATRQRLISAICLLLSALLLLPLQFASNFASADRSGETMVREQWTRILSTPIPENSILISNDRDEMMPMWYMQYVENTRRDLLGLFPLISPGPLFANVVRLTDGMLGVGRPIYFVKQMPGIEIKYNLTAADPLVRVVGRAADVLPQFAANAALADRLRVVGYSLAREPEALRVTIYWQPRAKMEHDYTSFVHLLDSNGNKVAQGDDHQVGGEFYPTSFWDVGETLLDEQVVMLPRTFAPGMYHLVVGMYAPPDSELGEPAEIGQVQITTGK